jgi:hypothetical protein
MTGSNQIDGRYWPIDPEGAGRVLRLNAGGTEIVVPRQDAAVAPGDVAGVQLSGLFDLFPELRELAEAVAETGNLAAEVSKFAREGQGQVARQVDLLLKIAGQSGEVLQMASDQIARLAERVTELESRVSEIDGGPGPGDPEPGDYDPGPEVDDEGGMSEHRHGYAGGDH